MKIINNRSTGFTLIELMIATTIFAMVLTVMLAAFLQIGRMYYKGVSVNSTLETTQAVIDDIENGVRFANNVTCANKPAQPTDPPNCTPDSTKPDIHYFCVGDHRYTYFLSNTTPYQINGEDITNPNPANPKGIIQDTITGCQPPSVSGTNAKQLMTPNMQLNNLEFYCVDSGCYVHLHLVLYGGDNTVFSSSAFQQDTPGDHTSALVAKDNYCSGSLMSTDFCAVGDLATVINLGE